MCPGGNVSFSLAVFVNHVLNMLWCLSLQCFVCWYQNLVFNAHFYWQPMQWFPELSHILPVPAETLNHCCCTVIPVYSHWQNPSETWPMPVRIKAVSLSKDCLIILMHAMLSMAFLCLGSSLTPVSHPGVHPDISNWGFSCLYPHFIQVKPPPEFWRFSMCMMNLKHVTSVLVGLMF